MPSSSEEHLYLFDLASEKHSPITTILQILACLLGGNAAALRLLWCEGYDSMQAWRDENQAGEVIVLQRAIFCVAAWVSRRHGGYTKMPWTLARLADGTSLVYHDSDNESDDQQCAIRDSKLWCGKFGFRLGICYGSSPQYESLRRSKPIFAIRRDSFACPPQCLSTI